MGFAGGYDGELRSQLMAACTYVYIHVYTYIGEGTYLQKVFIKSFCRSQPRHKFVNLFFMLVIVNDKLTNLWGG